MLARAPLRPGEEERKTEIETAGGRGKIWADRVGGIKDKGTREPQARRLPHPVTQPHFSISVIMAPGY